MENKITRIISLLEKNFNSNLIKNTHEQYLVRDYILDLLNNFDNLAEDHIRRILILLSKDERAWNYFVDFPHFYANRTKLLERFSQSEIFRQTVFLNACKSNNISFLRFLGSENYFTTHDYLYRLLSHSFSPDKIVNIFTSVDYLLQPDNQGKNILHYAFQKLNLPIFREMLKKEFSTALRLLHQYDHNYNTPPLLFVEAYCARNFYSTNKVDAIRLLSTSHLIKQFSNIEVSDIPELLPLVNKVLENIQKSGFQSFTYDKYSSVINRSFTESLLQTIHDQCILSIYQAKWMKTHQNTTDTKQRTNIDHGKSFVREAKQNIAFSLANKLSQFLQKETSLYAFSR